MDDVLPRRICNLAASARANNDYRRVVYTGPHSQIALMRVDDVIPRETHDYVTQLITVADGRAAVTVDGVRQRVRAGETVIIPPGVPHTVERRGRRPLRLYTIYAPPQHRRGEVVRRRGDEKNSNKVVFM